MKRTHFRFFRSPAHAYDWTRRKEVDEAGEEGLLRQVGVVLFRHLLGGPHHLQTHELVPALLESRDDITYQAALNAIGFDGQEGPFLVGPGLTVNRQRLAVAPTGRVNEQYESRRPSQCSNARA
jgi:hypothetical protein